MIKNNFTFFNETVLEIITAREGILIHGMEIQIFIILLQVVKSDLMKERDLLVELLVLLLHKIQQIP